jgi:hypothetical protein
MLPKSVGRNTRMFWEGKGVYGRCPIVVNTPFRFPKVVHPPTPAGFKVIAEIDTSAYTIPKCWYSKRKSRDNLCNVVFGSYSYAS